MIEFTKERTAKFGEWIFNKNFPDHEFGEWKDQGAFIQNDWISNAVDAIYGYECVMKFIEDDKND